MTRSLASMNMYPSASQLLDAVADFLEAEVMAAVPGDVAHKVRVAANLARIVGRETDLAAAARSAEQSRLTALLGHAGEVEDLRAELAEKLRSCDDPDFERSAWLTMVAVVRDELGVVKPGHDEWEGR